jgi:hypothetical protein
VPNQPGGATPGQGERPQQERLQEHRQLEALYADGWYGAITDEMFG